MNIAVLKTSSAATPPLTARHWIGGEWLDSPRRLDSFNAATGESIGTYADGGEAEAILAIAAARKAFLESDWRHDRRLRAKAINDMADRFEDRIEDLVEFLMLENGKIAEEARFEVSMAAPKLRFYAALALTEALGENPHRRHRSETAKIKLNLDVETFC